MSNWQIEWFGGSRMGSLTCLAGQLGSVGTAYLESYMWPLWHSGLRVTMLLTWRLASVPREPDKSCVAFLQLALQVTHITSDTCYSSLESHWAVQIQGRHHLVIGDNKVML